MASTVNSETITVGEAANILNVSRPYLEQLLKEGKIAYHQLGKHRRLRIEDVVRYREYRQKIASDALQNLADQAQELNMGY